jgi:hypothetical protein
MDADLKETLSRPIKYAVIACYATRDAIKDIDVDLTKLEVGLQAKVDSLTATVEALIERLETSEEETEQRPVSKAKSAKKKG